MHLTIGEISGKYLIIINTKYISKSLMLCNEFFRIFIFIVNLLFENSLLNVKLKSLLLNEVFNS